MKEIICHKCSHSINEHDMGWGECQRIGCSCRLTPNDVAIAVVEQAKREVADEAVRLIYTWVTPKEHAENVAKIFRDIARDFAEEGSTHNPEDYEY